MTHKRKRSKKQHQINPNDILANKVNVTLHQLVQLIHRFNPTNDQINLEERTERYKLKSRLQSLLIRRFGDELEVEQPDPENSQLVGFRLRHFGEDACHALLSELDEDVRSWTQRIIDEAKTTIPSESSRFLSRNYRSKKINDKVSTSAYIQSSEVEKGENDLTEDQLIKLGEQAMAEYDYSSSEDYLQRAFILSNGSVKAAIPLLELFIDHLVADEKALELSKSLSRIGKKDEGVRILLALAAARSGRIELALEYVHRISHSRIAEIYLLVAKHFLKQGDADRATEFLERLRVFEEQAELRLEIDQLRQDIHTVHKKNLEPVEMEMIKAWESNCFEEAFDLADKLLERWPENKSARKIHNTLERQKRNEKIKMLLAQADEAKKNEDYNLEVDLLTQSISLGVDEGSLTKRIEKARIKARQKSEQAEIDKIEKLWIDGEREKALLEFIGLVKKHRERIMTSLLDPHFTWIEQIISSKAMIKSEKIVEAVLILGNCNEILSRCENPRHIIADLKKHSKALQAVPKANDLLLQAEMMAKNFDSEKSRSMLEKAERFLAMDKLKEASESLECVKVSLLSENDQKLFNNIHSNLLLQEKIHMLYHRYKIAVNNSDILTARNIATQLAEVNADHKAFQHWKSKITEHTILLNKDWCLVTADIGDLPGCYGGVGLDSYSDNYKCCMHQDGRHLIIASSHERWLFLRFFCLDEHQFKKIAVLRVPRAIEFLNLEIANGSIWIVGIDGNVLEIGMEELEIRSWYDFHDYASEEEIFESTFFLPQSRCLWLQKSRPKSRFENIYVIIDIDKSHIIRQLAAEFFPVMIKKEEGFCVAIQDTSRGFFRIYSERGKMIDRIELETDGLVDKAALHPNGIDYIFLPYDNSGAFDYIRTPDQDTSWLDGDFMLNIEVKPDAEKKIEPIKIEDSSGEMRHDIATSLDSGIVFILFRTNSSTEKNCRLAAFKAEERGFKRLYQVDMPDSVQFAYDASTRQVVIVNPLDSNFQAVRLDASSPNMVFDNGGTINWCALPAFDPPWFCKNPTGDFHATYSTFLKHLGQSSPSEISKIAQGMQLNQSADPGEIRAFIAALEYKRHLEEAESLKLWLREKYPDNSRVLVDLACEAAEQEKWHDVVSLLKDVSHDQLDEGTARHVCHLLGMGYFINHNIEKALSTWENGLKYKEGTCKLNELIEYAKFSKKPFNERESQGKKSDVWRELEVYKVTDSYLTSKRWDAAIEILENSNVLQSEDLQIRARLAEAYLNQNHLRAEKRWFCKVVALASYCRIFHKTDFRKNQLLPPYIERWSNSRLADVAKRSKLWLEHEN